MRGWATAALRHRGGEAAIKGKVNRRERRDRKELNRRKQRQQRRQMKNLRNSGQAALSTDQSEGARRACAPSPGRSAVRGWSGSEICRRGPRTRELCAKYARRFFDFCRSRGGKAGQKTLIPPAKDLWVIKFARSLKRSQRLLTSSPTFQMDYGRRGGGVRVRTILERKSEPPYVGCYLFYGHRRRR